MRHGLAVWIAAALAGTGCSGASAPDPVAPPPTTVPTPEPPPVLSVPMVDLDGVVNFIPFGAPLANGATNPAYDFVTSRRGVDVRAVAAGVVTVVGAQPEYGDFEIHVRPTPSSDYLVIYDHVRDLGVAEGASVSPGDRLGAVGHGNPGQGHVELQINRRGPPDVAVCPRELGTEAFNAAHDAALRATGSPHPGVCLAPTVIP